MTDPITNQAAQQMAEQALQQGSAEAQPEVPEQEVDAADQARFDQALNSTQDVPAEQAAESVQHACESQPAEAARPTLGDAILDGIEQLKTNHDAHLDRIQEQLNATGGEGLNVEDAMRLQFEVMQLSIEQDLTTKMADKTSQGVQTLFRNQ